MQSAKAPMGHVTSRSQSLALRSSCQAVTNLTRPVSQLAPHTLRLIRCHVAGHADAQQHASTSFLSPCPSVRLQRCHHSRSVRIQTGVFDKIRDILSGDSSGWAGPPEGRAEQAAAGGSAREEEDEGAELVKIDVEGRTGLGGTSEDAFGALAVLLVGFMQSEVDAFRALMNEMDADIVKLIPCQHSMFDGSLLEAFNTDCPQYEQPPLGQRRALFMSGMYGSEVTELISAYRDAGLPPCVFAGLVPNNANRNVGELLEAVWRDHAAMQMAMAKLQQKESPDGEVEDSY